MGRGTGCRPHPCIITFVDQDDVTPGKPGVFILELKININMSYTTRRSGFTGPSNKIGGSTAYHQDLKLLEALPIAERVKMLDAIALQNQSIGREIEFSDPAVSGQRWNLGADLSDKIDLLNKAAAAHSHSTHPGWQSLDYYTPFKGKTRFDKGAVEDASIYLPAVAGGKITRGSGGNYGYYSESLDPSGRVIARVGHGNVDRPETDAEVLIPINESSGTTNESPGTANAVTGVTEQEFLNQYVKTAMEEQLKYGLMAQMLQPKKSDTIANFQNFMQALGQQGMGNPLL